VKWTSLYTYAKSKHHGKSRQISYTQYLVESSPYCWNWSPPVAPTDNWSLDLAPWSGAQPKTRLVGPRRATNKEEVGTDCSRHEVRLPPLFPTSKTLTRSEREAAAAGSATTPSPERRHHHVVSARRCPSADPHRRTRGGSWRKKVTFRFTPSRS